MLDHVRHGHVPAPHRHSNPARFDALKVEEKGRSQRAGALGQAGESVVRAWKQSKCSIFFVADDDESDAILLGPAGLSLSTQIDASAAREESSARID